MKLGLRYTAGLFDGEGWFQIDKAPTRPRCLHPSYQVHARLVMRDRRLVYAMKQTFGGSIRPLRSTSRRHAQYYSWDVCGEGVAAFASRIGRFLVAKRRQAILANAFQAFKRQNTNRPNTAVRVRRLDSYYCRMRHLNRKGVSR